MSLLDDAKRLTDLADVDCVFCDAPLIEIDEDGNDVENHLDWCPVPRIPKIVAALEAIALYDRDENWMGGEWAGPGSCGDVARYALGLDIEDWGRENIERALQRNVVP